MKVGQPASDIRHDLDLIERLRGAEYDGAAIFTVYSQSPLPAALLCYLANIPLRLAHCRENPYRLLTDWVAESEPERGWRHEVRRQLDLVATVGSRTSDERLSLRVSSAAMQRVAALLAELGITPDDRWLVLHAGASAPSRRYPLDQFAAAARLLESDQGWRVLLSGSAGESALVEDLRGMIGGSAVSLAGRLDLEELAALIERAPLLVSNNSGPVHIASAVGTPVVDLYALTNPQHTPWGVPNRVLYHDVPCKYCYRSICPEGHHNCLRLVPPEALVAAVRDLTDGPSPGAVGA
jgi:lipopolysaccharide heptosyltransferase II